MSAPLVEASNLTAGVSASAGQAVLDEVSFAIEAGERVALVGPSGAGKTSLVRLILGLDRPVRRLAGRIAVEGQDIYALSPTALRSLRRRAMAFVPQNPASALDPLKTLRAQWRQNLSTIADARLQQEADQLLAAFGLADRMNGYPCECSRGMQQRLLIAMALARGPRLLIMDEPTSALDPILAAEIMRSVLHHAHESGAAVLLVTHHPGVAAALSDRRIRLDAGRIVPEASPFRLVARAGDDQSARVVTNRGEPVITARDVAVSLGGATILSDVSVTLRPGESVAIVGESGAGKSTLLRAILGLLPLAQGVILRKGKTPGFVSQDPLSALHPTMRCFDAIAEPLVADGVAPAEIDERVRAVANLLGLGPGHLERTTHALSVGQAQRACLARALIANASLIVFDEPLSALDEATAGEVIVAIERARAAHGTATLFVTHDLGFAQRIAERIIVLRQGRIVETGSVAGFFRAPCTAYGQALVEAARAIGEVREAAA